MMFNQLMLKEDESSERKLFWQKLQQNIKNLKIKEAKSIVAFKSNLLCIYDKEEHLIYCGHVEEDKYISNIQVINIQLLF